MRPEAPALRDLQRAFAARLRTTGPGPSPGDVSLREAGGISADDRAAVYRNNTRLFFHNALALTYPVLQRRVGDDFFRQLAHEYHASHPSRSGDLHWVGAEFPAWLESRLTETAYAWLADLAKLEWACEESMAAAQLPPVDLEALATIPAEGLEHASVRLQPSLRLLVSTHPVASVWQSNQDDGDGAAVDLAQGTEHCASACDGDRVVVYRLQPTHHALLVELNARRAFGEAIEAAGATAEDLSQVLGWMFAENLVVAVSPSDRA
jgi:hypothetical protein